MAEMRMLKRTLGQTGLEVSVLGFGGSPLGGIFEDVDDQVAIAAVHRAFELGVNFFDTSPFYGITKSETVLGKAFKELPRDELVIATKVGRYGMDEFDFSTDRVTRCFHESRERLQVEYVDIVQCHDIEFGDMDQVVNQALPALSKLKEEGYIRHIGVTGLPLKIYRTVLDRAPAGDVDVTLSYCHYCLNDRSLVELIPYLLEKGVGVINASSLSMGLLTHGGPPEWHPAPTELREAAVAAAKVCEDNECDLSRIALMWAFKNEMISSTLVGMQTPELVEQNVTTVLQALGVIPNPRQEVEDAVLKQIEEVLAPVMNMTWPSGRPENN